ncbi:transforming acidic coiled-coil-containing protein 1-like [Tribolium madens]|uniref:transforming acidic coiled-coil-containing protein 1-like n=1 Tax=Tribolium madens TaxID=41895 RepID=UPI001CF73F8E|nr:transforming acidic coiled-coil-containing protein 1-like [Tribolium madens]
MLSQLYRNLFKNPQTQSEKSGADQIDLKVSEMEQKISRLEEQNEELRKQLEYNRNKEAALQKVLCNYDNLLKKVIMERNNKTQDDSSFHLTNLETAFYDLLRKYEKAKLVVHDFQQNETALKKQVIEYEDILENLRTKFVAYKSVSDKKVTDTKHLPLKKTKSCDNSKTKKRLMTTI